LLASLQIFYAAGCLGGLTRIVVLRKGAGGEKEKGANIAPLISINPIMAD